MNGFCRHPVSNATPFEMRPLMAGNVFHENALPPLSTSTHLGLDFCPLTGTKGSSDWHTSFAQIFCKLISLFRAVSCNHRQRNVLSRNVVAVLSRVVQDCLAFAVHYARLRQVLRFQVLPLAPGFWCLMLGAPQTQLRNCSARGWVAFWTNS